VGDRVRDKVQHTVGDKLGDKSLGHKVGDKAAEKVPRFQMGKWERHWETRGFRFQIGGTVPHTVGDTVGDKVKFCMEAKHCTCRAFYASNPKTCTMRALF
jgi:hypothetical protein